MSENTVGPSEDYEDLVRDALLHLHDPSYLQTHPLAMRAAGSGAIARGKWLYRLLLDSIAALRPTSGTPTASRSWRTYRILELRYIDAREVADVIDRLAISRIQYYRDHHRALQALASVLRDRWPATDGSEADSPIDARPMPNALELARREAKSLRQARTSPTTSATDLTETLRAVGRLIEPLCSRRGVELRLEVAEDLPGIRGERVALRQALLSVLTAALNVVGRGTVDVRAERRGGQVEVAVGGSSADNAVAAGPEQLGVEESRPFVEAVGGAISYSVSNAAPWD